MFAYASKTLLVLVGLSLVISMAAAPAHAAQAGKGPVKVFLLVGQSNMEGKGSVKFLKDLATAAATKAKYGHLVDKDGNWVTRDDVWIWYMGKKGGLSVGYASRERFGVELQFGHVVGSALDNQVLLLKVAWGGRSLTKNFRPPSSGGEVGDSYTAMLKHIREVLDDLKAQFPDYDGKGYEIAGFVWFQGWNDRINQKANDEYEKNLANFIRDVRKELKVKDMPFIIGETGQGGVNEKHPRAVSLMRHQAAVAKLDEFKGNVGFVETKCFFENDPKCDGGYHFFGNPQNFFNIGNAMGKAMLGLLKAGASEAKPAAAKDIPPKVHPDVSKWDDLLKADLSNATYPKGIWSFEKGILTATKDINLWTKKQYDNFIVDVEFKTAPGTNSGVIVYCSNTGKWIPNSVEIQIADDHHPKWGKADKTWQCAAIFGHLAASERMVKKPGQWNRFTITCVDHMIYVMLNQMTVTIMDMRKWTSAKTNPDGSKIPPWLSIPKAKLATKGHIGFQGKHGGVPIYFRNIKIKELKAK